MTEKELIFNYFNGDEEALKILIERYLKPTYSFIYRLVGNKEDAEDITQDVFLKVWKNLKKYDDSKSFKTWLFTIAKNTSFDLLRKKREVVFSDLEKDNEDDIFSDNLISDEILPEIASIKKEEIAELDRAIEDLSVDQRAVLFLKETEELTFEEIGEILKKPMNTVKSHYRRAILSLKKTLDAPK